MPRIILEIFWDTRSPNKIFESRDKDSRTFHRMDLALQKYDNNFQKSLENSKIFFMRFKYFIWTSRVPNYLQDFFLEFSGYISYGLKDVSRLFQIYVSLKIYSERIEIFLSFISGLYSTWFAHRVFISLIFHPDQITLETESYLDFDVFR